MDQANQGLCTNISLIIVTLAEKCITVTFITVNYQGKVGLFIEDHIKVS